MGPRKKSHRLWLAGGLGATLAFGALAVRPGELAAPPAVPHPAPARPQPPALLLPPEGWGWPAVSRARPALLPEAEARFAGDPAGGGPLGTADSPLPLPSAGDLFAGERGLDPASDPLFPAAARPPESGARIDLNAAALADIRAAAARRPLFVDPGAAREPAPCPPKAGGGGAKAGQGGSRPAGPPPAAADGPLAARPASPGLPEPRRRLEPAPRAARA